MKLTKLKVIVCFLVILICAPAIALTSIEDELEKACAHLDVAKIAALVKAGADPNGEGSYRGSPLYVAIKYDNIALVRLLLARGADPNVSSAKCGLLREAFDSNLSILQILLTAGADTNCVWADKSGAGDQSKGTPLMFAASLKGLRMNGQRLAWADRPIRKDTPRSVDVIKLLLQFGAKPNTRDYFGRNALYDAIDADDVDAARALIDDGLDVNAKMDFSTSGAPDPYEIGQTALVHALMRYDDNRKETANGTRMIHMLLRKGADPNVPPLGHYTPDCGHGPPPCGFVGETPLSYIAEKDYLDVAQMLLRYGAEPNAARSDGMKPAEIAEKAGHARTATLILRYERKRIFPLQPGK